MEEKKGLGVEVNRLYWNTGDSVAEISNRLGVSRRALYELLEPLPSGAQCANCGAELYYSNRSAKAAGVTRCLICGREREIEDEVLNEGTAIPPYAAGWPTTSRHAVELMRDRAVALAGFAIAGVVAGTIVALLIRRKR